MVNSMKRKAMSYLYCKGGGGHLLEGEGVALFSCGEARIFFEEKIREIFSLRNQDQNHGQGGLHFI